MYPQRPAFDWFYPDKVAVDLKHSPCSLLYEVWEKWSRQHGSPLEYLTIDGSTGLQISAGRINDIIKELFRTVLADEQANMVTSYSWRRFPPTMADLFLSSTEQINHFGGWAGVYGKKGAREVHRSMAYRYNGRKAEQEMYAKLEHWTAFQEVCSAATLNEAIPVNALACTTWEHLAAACQHQGSDKRTTLDAARQDAASWAAEQLLQRHGEPAWGAPEAHRPLRFILTHVKEQRQRETVLPLKAPSNATVLQALQGYQWVEPLLGKVIHHTPLVGPPPELLCKQKKLGAQRQLRSAYHHHVGWQAAVNTGKHCCGGCWRLLPPAVRVDLKARAPGFVPPNAA